jgi:hypothetical protein
MSMRDERVGAGARLADPVTDEQQAGPTLGERLGDGLAHLAWASDAGEQHVAALELHVHLSRVNERRPSRNGVGSVARSM